MDKKSNSHLLIKADGSYVYMYYTRIAITSSRDLQLVR